MDQVTVEKLIQKYKDNGELEREDPALVMLKQWPGSKQYKDNPEALPGLEQKVKSNNLCLDHQSIIFLMKIEGHIMHYVMREESFCKVVIAMPNN